jgi:hypothetical protein
MVASAPNWVMFKRKSLYAVSHGELNTNADAGIVRWANRVTA